MKQYLPLKPVKRGFKVWALADSLNGYLCDFNIYTGATGGRETALGEKVVLTLTESIKGKNHQYIFSFLFDVAVTNAFILHSFDVTAVMELKQFRMTLANQLIGNYSSRQ